MTIGCARRILRPRLPQGSRRPRTISTSSSTVSRTRRPQDLDFELEGLKGLDGLMDLDFSSKVSKACKDSTSLNGFEFQKDLLAYKGTSTPQRSLRRSQGLRMGQEPLRKTEQGGKDESRNGANANARRVLRPGARASRPGEVRPRDRALHRRRLDEGRPGGRRALLQGLGAEQAGQRPEALTTISTLVKDYPKSRYLKQAKPLEVESSPRQRPAGTAGQRERRRPEAPGASTRCTTPIRSRRSRCSRSCSRAPRRRS